MRFLWGERTKWFRKLLSLCRMRYQMVLIKTWNYLSCWLAGGRARNWANMRIFFTRSLPLPASPSAGVISEKCEKIGLIASTQWQTVQGIPTGDALDQEITRRLSTHFVWCPSVVRFFQNDVATVWNTGQVWSVQIYCAWKSMRNIQACVATSYLLQLNIEHNLNAMSNRGNHAARPHEPSKSFRVAQCRWLCLLFCWVRIRSG